MIHLFALLLLPQALGEKGCCYDYGLGAMMVPCCHSMNKAHKDGELMVDESDCPTEQRMGGETVFEAGVSCDEMQWYVAEEKESEEFMPPEDCECVETDLKDGKTWPAKCDTSPGGKTAVCYVKRSAEKPCEDSKLSSKATNKYVVCKASEDKGKMCCEAMTASCQACKNDMTVQQVCAAAKQKGVSLDGCERDERESEEFTYTVSLIMDKTCENMIPEKDAGGIYHEEEVLTRKSNVCTTNVLGSSVKFECMGDYIVEHVYIDASQEEAPDTPDCSGEPKYSMPIKNGCNGFDWGNVLMTWKDFCMTPMKPDCAAQGKIPQKESEGGGCRACTDKDADATEKDGRTPKYPQCRKGGGGDGEGKMCCEAITASCLACKHDVTVEQVCADAKQKGYPLDGCDQKPDMDLSDPKVVKMLAEKYKIPACANNEDAMKGFGGCVGAKQTLGGMSNDPCNYDLSVLQQGVDPKTYFWLVCPKTCDKCTDMTLLMIQGAMAKEKEEMERKKREEAEKKEMPDFSDPEVVGQLAKKYGVACADDNDSLAGFGGCEAAKATLKLMGAPDQCGYDLSTAPGVQGVAKDTFLWLVCPKLCNKCAMWTAGVVKKMWMAEAEKEAQKKEIMVKECTDDAYGELKMNDTTCDAVAAVAKQMGAQDACAFDLNQVSPQLPTGSAIWLFCPKSCNKCVEWKGYRLRQAQAAQKKKEEEGKDFDCTAQPKGVCKKLTGRCSWKGNKCVDAQCKCLGLKDKNARGHECSVFMPKNRKYTPDVQWCYVDLHACRGLGEKVKANTGAEQMPEGLGSVNCVDAGFKTKEQQTDEYQKALKEGRVKDPEKSKLNPKEKLCNQAELLGLVTSKLEPKDQPACFDAAANPNNIEKLCACFTKFKKEDVPDCYFFEDVSVSIADWYEICPSHVVIKATTYGSKRLCNQGGIENAITRSEWHGHRMDGECTRRDDDPEFQGLYGPSKMTCGGDGKIYWKAWEKSQGLEKNEGDELLCPSDDKVKPNFSAMVGNGDCVGREVMDRGEVVMRWTKYELNTEEINRMCKDKGPASCLDFTNDEAGCNGFGNCVWKNRKGKTSCKQKVKKGNRGRRTQKDRKSRERRARRRRRR